MLKFKIKQHTAIHEGPDGVIEFDVRVFTCDGTWRAIAWDRRGLVEEACTVRHHILIGDGYASDVEAMEACDAALPTILASAPRSSPEGVKAWLAAMDVVARP